LERLLVEQLDAHPASRGRVVFELARWACARQGMPLARLEALSAELALGTDAPLLHGEQAWHAIFDNLSAQTKAESRQLGLPLALGQLYERYLLGALSQRKKAGSYFTPYRLARATLVHALEGHRPRQLCDPAMGCGVFLLAALEEGGSGTRRARCEQLYGVDSDPLAVFLARVALWLAVAEPGWDGEACVRQLRWGDSLIGAWRADLGETGSRLEGAELRAALDAWVVEGFGGEQDGGCPFHWELAFPKVFEAGGFDLLVGNPPWEIRKGNSKEFFSRVDPEYVRLSKQEALRRQRTLFEQHPGLSQEWERYGAELRACVRWYRQAAARSPFPRPYVLGGQGDCNAYKLFVEQAFFIAAAGGRVAFCLPSGFYSDAGAMALRERFLPGALWLFGFENRGRIFPDVDARSKFCLFVADKPRAASAVPLETRPAQAFRAAFMRRELADWEQAPANTLAYPLAALHGFSPRSLALLEFEAARDLEVFCRLREHTVFLSEPALQAHTWRELDTTLDSHRFVSSDRLEVALDANGHAYRQAEDGRWLRGPWRPRAPGDTLVVYSSCGCQALPVSAVEGVAFAVYQGAMIGQYSSNAAAYAGGANRSVVWRARASAEQPLAPQFLVLQDALRGVEAGSLRLVYRTLSNATNERTAIATLLEAGATANSLACLRLGSGSLAEQAFAVAVMNSFVFDWMLRLRMVGTNLNAFVLMETLWPPLPGAALLGELEQVVARLLFPERRHVKLWQGLCERHPALQRLSAGSRYVSDARQRVRLRAGLEARVARLYGLDVADFRWLLLERERELGPRHPKGFWRVDRELPEAQRLPHLSMRAFEAMSATAAQSHDLESV
jgi:hypothetical protein